MRFTFNGKLKLNPIEAEKQPYIRQGKTKDRVVNGKKVEGNPYKTFNGIVSSAKNNSAFIELFGMKSDKIFSMDADGNKIEIAWGDRNDKDVVASVANFRKNILKVGDERVEYISAYDMVDGLEDLYDVLNGSNVCVTGNVRRDFYNGKVTNRFQVQNIYTTDEDAKPGLKVNMIIFFNKDSYDFADYASEKKIYINGYTSEYIPELKENKYIAQQLVLDAGKIDFENEKHIKLLKFKMKMLGIDYNDNKPKCGLKGSNYHEMSVICNYINGAEKRIIEISDLTENQRLSIECGLKTLEFYQNQGDVYGERVTLMKVVDFQLNSEKYSDGPVDSEIKSTEFEDLVFIPTPNSLNIEIENEIKNTTTDDSDDLDSLFD